MRRVVSILVTVVACSGFLFAKARFDIGLNTALYAGIVTPRNIYVEKTISGFLREHPVPLPSVGLYAQTSYGHLNLGVGVRSYTFILETILWPNLYAELDFSRLTILAQIGGGVFGYFGLIATGVDASSQLYFPDLSAWFKLGKNVRIGGGILGVYWPDLMRKIKNVLKTTIPVSPVLPYMGYCGLQVVLY